jgi:hypothetical protein
MLILPSPAHVVRAVALFKAQCDVVRLKNRFARPSGGLRDILLNLCIDGVYCEVQVGIGTLVAVRRKMHKYYGVVRSIGAGPLVLMSKELTAMDVGAAAMAEVAASARARQPALDRVAGWMSDGRGDLEVGGLLHGLSIVHAASLGESVEGGGEEGTLAAGAAAEAAAETAAAPPDAVGASGAVGAP